MGLKKVLGGLMFSAFLASPSPVVSAASSNPDNYGLTLSWHASSSPDVAAYRVYYGNGSGTYPNILAVDKVTTAIVSGLSAGVTYYFAVTGVDANGLESPFSNEARYVQTLPAAQLEIQALSAGQFRLIVTGTAGHTYDIETTQDFRTWTVIGTVTADPSGLLIFTDTNAAAFPMRFYRTPDKS